MEPVKRNILLSELQKVDLEPSCRTTLEGAVANTVANTRLLMAADHWGALGRCEYHPWTMTTQPKLTVYRTALHPMRMVVVNLDCLLATGILARGRVAPALMNFANEYNCGGGFTHTTGAQEEHIFRCSTLMASLWPRRRSNDTRHVPGNTSDLFPSQPPIYPFTECGVAYSPYCCVFKDQHGALLPSHDRFLCAVVSVAAQDLRPGRSYNKRAEFDRKLTSVKIRGALALAAKWNHRSVVLGALGCGAFRNPPEEVACIFREVLYGEFRDAFDMAVFAIVKSTENITVFSRVLGCPVMDLADFEDAVASLPPPPALRRVTSKGPQRSPSSL